MKPLALLLATSLMVSCASNDHYWASDQVSYSQTSQDFARCEYVATQLAQAEFGGAQIYNSPIRQKIYLSGSMSNVSVSSGLDTFYYNASDYTQGAVPARAAVNTGSSANNGFAVGIAKDRYMKECMTTKGYHLQSKH